MKYIFINIPVISTFFIGMFFLMSPDTSNRSIETPPTPSQEELQITNQGSTYESTAMCPICNVTDSLALIRLYQQTAGWAWTGQPWQTWQKVCMWSGITLDSDGYVTEIFLNNRNLTGPLPTEIGDFSRLEKLQIDNNNINGSIPSSIGNLSTLEVCFIDDNELVGDIPESMGDLNSLVTLFMDNNELTGNIPTSMATMSSLQDFQFFNNNIDSVPNLLTITSLLPNKLRMQNNALTFDDILPNMGFQMGVHYRPQDSIWLTQTLTAQTGSNFILDLDIDDGITDNKYNWYKDNVWLFETNDNNIAFNGVHWSDAGDYRCVVTNDGAPLLTLYSRTTTLVVECGVSIENINPTVCNDQEVVINGITYNSLNPSGTQSVGRDQYDCDSMLNISLNFYTIPTGMVTDTLCDGGSLMVNGTMYNQGNPSGSEFLPDASHQGCDSFVNINLSFYTPIAAGNFNQSLCEDESVVVNGTTYNMGNPSGTENLPNASFQGCDSTVLVNITFFSNPVNQIEDELCPDGFIVVNGTRYDSANPTGTENLTNLSFRGCDSIVNVDLSFAAIASSNYFSTICPEESVVVNGTTYNMANPSGTETLFAITDLGCDSIINVMLDFHAPAVGNLNSIICEDDQVIINGTIYDKNNPTGSEFLDDANFRGCDSTVNVNLSFFPVASSTTNPRLCSDESVSINGAIYNAANPTGVEVLNNANFRGCDSTVTISVIMVNDATLNYDPILCETESVVVNGTNYNFSNPTGTEIFSNASYTGCDSIVSVNLTFHTPATSTVNSILCNDESMTVNSVLYNAANPSGTEIVSGGGQYGCDSTITVDLQFHDIASSNYNATLCQDESVVINGMVYNFANPTGTEILTNSNFQGCDSTVSINLNFYSPILNTIDNTLCTGSAIVVNGTTYDATNPNGTEIMTNASFHGCDSTVLVDLTFDDISTMDFFETFCQGTSVNINGTVYDAGNMVGTETITGGSYLGCDSVISVSLSFYDMPEGSENGILCLDESITVNGTIYNAGNRTGTETLTTSSWRGCDSLVTIDLNFYDPIVSDFSPSLCADETTMVNGTIYGASNLSGTEVLANASATGCDSTVNVLVNIISIPTGAFTQTLCFGQTISINGTVYNETNFSGLETIPNGSYQGCDSSFTVDLTFTNFSLEEVDQTLCSGQEITVNGIIYNEGNPTGTETITGGSSSGCDSIITVTLAFVQDISFNLVETYCSGESIIVGTDVFDETNPSGTVLLSNSSYLGCDSTVNVDLTFYNASSFDLNNTFCSGGSISVNGVVYDESNQDGQETIVGGSFRGCDSIVNIDLTFQEEAVEDIIQNLCTGQSLLVNGVVYDAGNPIGQETIPNGSFYGCDSIINIDLNFNDQVVENINGNYCNGQSITVNGSVYNAGNPMGQELIPNGSVFGCDSVINVAMSFLDEAVENIIETYCSGESITVNGVVYDEDNAMGQEMIPNGSFYGCDSTINVNLTFSDEVVENISGNYCNGQAVTVNGVVYDADNTMGQEMILNGSFYGCDSIINVNLTFSNPSSTINESICNGASYLLNGTEYDAQGTYTEIIPNGSAQGCDSTVVLNLEVIEDSSLEFAAASHNGDECGGEIALDANLPSGALGQWTTSSGAIIENQDLAQTFASELPAGESTIIWTLSTELCGDYSSDTLFISTERDPIAADDAESLTEENILIDIIQNDQLFDSPGQNIRLLSQPTIGTAILENNMVAYSIEESFNGIVSFDYEICRIDCENLCATATVRIDVAFEAEKVNIPGGITPNGDGLNDLFVIDDIELNPELYPNAELIVFNRYGDEVFVAQPYQNDWDGTNQKGQELPHGTYYYVLRLNTGNGQTYKGDVTILK